jgi:hypothetical protein
MSRMFLTVSLWHSTVFMHNQKWHRCPFNTKLAPKRRGPYYKIKKFWLVVVTWTQIGPATFPHAFLLIARRSTLQLAIPRFFMEHGREPRLAIESICEKRRVFGFRRVCYASTWGYSAIRHQMDHRNAALDESTVPARFEEGDLVWLHMIRRSGPQSQVPIDLIELKLRPTSKQRKNISVTSWHIKKGCQTPHCIVD